MGRRSSISGMALAALLCATVASAFELPQEVTLGGRLDAAVELDKRASGFPWNFTSRSPEDRTRLMLDLRASKERYGALYLKTTSNYNGTPGTDFTVQVEFEQGDYFYQRSFEGVNTALRAFVDERRYFTRSLTVGLLDDEHLARFDRHWGGRLDVGAGDFALTAIGASLEDDTARDRSLAYASASYMGQWVVATAAVRHTNPAADSLANQVIVRWEVGGYLYRGTVLASYGLSGREDASLFWPDGGLDFGAGGVTSALPDGGAVAGEIRWRDQPLGFVRADIVHRYRATGRGYMDDLSVSRAGETVTTTGLYLRHRDYAVDGRIEYRDADRWLNPVVRTRGVDVSARFLLANGMDITARGWLGERDEGTLGKTDYRFVHGIWQKSGEKLWAALHAMLASEDPGETRPRFALQSRYNFSAATAFNMRLIVDERDPGAESIFWRFEFRPTDHVFATVGRGRVGVGDDAFLLEDPVLTAGLRDDMYFITVRGDF